MPYELPPREVVSNAIDNIKEGTDIDLEQEYGLKLVDKDNPSHE